MKDSGLNWPLQIPHVLWIKRSCPLCSSVEFQEAESASLDGLLKLLALHAVRCKNCWRRYYWFGRPVTVAR